MKNNQAKSNRGGARPGAGRKPNTPNKRTAELQRSVEESGLTPVEFLTGIYRDEGVALDTRIDAAKAVAPYVHARLSSIDAKIGTDGPLQVVINKPGA